MRLAPGALLHPACVAAPFLFIAPLVAGRRVLVLTGDDVANASRTRRLVELGAAQVSQVRVSPHGDLEGRADDGACDLVVGFGRLAELAEPEARARLLASLSARLAPQGLLVLDAPAAECDLRAADQAALARSEVERLARQSFRHVRLVAQVPFFGFVFEPPEDEPERVTINEELFPAAASPSGWLLVAAHAPLPREALDKLVVPVLRPAAATREAASRGEGDDAALARRVEELLRERDALLEQLMTAEDQRDRALQTVVTLRRESERQLRRLAEQASALELMGLEQDLERRRALEAEVALGPEPGGSHQP